MIHLCRKTNVPSVAHIPTSRDPEMTGRLAAETREAAEAADLPVSLTQEKREKEKEVENKYTAAGCKDNST